MDPFNLTLCGCDLALAFWYRETASFFEKYYPQGVSGRGAEGSSPGPQEAAPGPDPIRVRAEDWPIYAELGMGPGPATEFSILTEYCSDALLAHDCAIIHAAALRWRDRAYLICANSGVGKSTQAKTLQTLRPGEFGIICGDRPVLQFRHSEPCRDGTLPSAASPVSHCHSERSEAESKNPSSFVQSLPLGGKVSPQTTDEGSIIVHPSPWNGKENWHGADPAPLAGIILLERGEENRLVSLSEREAVLPMYAQFIHTGREPENIRRVAALETRLLRSVPLWKLTTCEVPDSTRLLLESVFPAPE